VVPGDAVRTIANAPPAAWILTGCGSPPADDSPPTPFGTFTIEKLGGGETEFDSTCVEIRRGSGRFDCTDREPRRMRCRGLTANQADRLGRVRLSAEANALTVTCR
jgi:hypothetical protein